ncbi:MAG: hypothetical protein AB1429_15155 [Pseudomonadota bacterium]|jgi:hypothetical protein
MGAASELGHSPVSAPSTAELLVSGGDARLSLDPRTGWNRYGCPPAPLTTAFDFASSTASSISPRALVAADALRADWVTANAPDAIFYATELERMRGELIALNGLSDLAGLAIIFAASGTDLHLMAAELMRGETAEPLICAAVEPEETGSGVPNALMGRHFSDRAALGAPVPPGESLAGRAGEFVAIRAREPDGALRSDEVVAAELNALALRASLTGRRLLLTLTDVSKTGLIAPSIETVIDLRQRYPRTVEVLVDACQFRLAPSTLRAYLQAGLMTAVTGSKFLCGPTFSGTLFAPARVAESLKRRGMRPGLTHYSTRADWPNGWTAREILPEVANLGLLLRWRAALTELAAFRALSEADVADFLQAFAEAVQARLTSDPRFELLATRALDRRAVGVAATWDAIPTIFPFRIRNGAGKRLNVAAMAKLYERLRDEGFRLGQPVSAGIVDGAPSTALRLCASARLCVEALSADGAGPDAVIGRALALLDAAADAASRLP